MTSRVLIASILLFLGSWPAHITAQHFHWKKIGVREGLQSANTFAVFESKDAYLWVGTDQGISRYDGYQFHNFSQAGSHRIGRVNDIVEDFLGRLWIASSQGVFRWEGTGFRLMPSSPADINCLLFDQDNRLWLGTGKGVYRLNDILTLRDLDEVESLRFDHLGVADTFQDDPRITDLLLSKSGEVWASSFYNLMVWRDNSWHNQWGTPHYKPDIVGVSETTDDVFLLSCEAAPPLLFNAQTGKANPMGDELILNSWIDGAEWYLLSYNKLFLHRDSAHQTILDGEATGIEWMRAMHQDQHNNIWIATFEGLIKLQPSAFQHFNPIDFPFLQEVYAINQDAKGQLLFGANQGQLFAWHENAVAPYFPQQPQLVPNAELFAIHRSTDGTIWLGSGYQGIVRIKEGTTQRWTTQEGLRDDARFFFYSAPDGSFWTGGDGGIEQIITLPNGGLSFRSFTYSVGSSYAVFYDAVMGPDQQLWVGGDYGLFVLNDAQLVPAQIDGFPRKDLSINSFAQDQKGNIWIATNGAGILRCHFDNMHQLVLDQQYSRQSGLHSEAILQLIVDVQGAVWASTYSGICRIDQQGQIRCYDAADGFLQRTYNQLCLYQADDNRIWAGSSEGVVSFFPDQIPVNEIAPQLYLERVLLFQGEESLRPYLKKINNRSRQLILPYSKNNLSFDYAGINLARPEKTRFQHRLLGLENDWIQSSKPERITYPKLPPGRYKLEIQASNEDGRRSDTLSYSFQIQAPFWMRWWFFVLLFFLAAAVVWLVLRQIQHRNKVKRQLLESKLQALQAQMNPHFLSNALNAIYLFILENNALAASRYLTKFSRLVRSILDNSRMADISLAKELEALRLYLELEKLRFEDKFEFKIAVDEALSTKLIRIPPLLIQPFAENAIWHGFMQQSSIGRLHIAITQENDLLCCTIEDNGIGREAAKAIQTQRGQQPGVGFRITANRLSLINQKAESLTIIDLYDDQQQACGTRVVMRLPLVYGLHQ